MISTCFRLKGKQSFASPITATKPYPMTADFVKRRVVQLNVLSILVEEILYVLTIVLDM